MMSQNALAKQLGISKSYLSMILSGQRTPRTELRNKLCTLGLFTDEANLTPHNPKVVGSNPTPATKFKAKKALELMIFRGLFYFTL